MTTRTEESNTRLTNSLIPCAECGKQPKIICDGMHYKLFCGAHNAWGSWYENKIQACLYWNRKQRELMWSPDRNLGEKLKSCPFCGRRMIFQRDECVNKYGTPYVQQYYMHDYPEGDDDSVRCVLDEACEVFTIPAGDARPDTGEIGEYAKLWNQRASPL